VYLRHHYKPIFYCFGLENENLIPVPEIGLASQRRFNATGVGVFRSDCGVRFDTRSRCCVDSSTRLHRTHSSTVIVKSQASREKRFLETGALRQRKCLTDAKPASQIARDKPHDAQLKV
jgi:hypothetical protein